VLGFGVVSLLADLVYEGARSITGPLLASLGATALVVGLVTGAGEAMALLLRLVSGRLADRTGRYWGITLAGYGLTAVSVPALAAAPFVGGAGVLLASVLILAERVGKAVRSPAKSALLAQAAADVGMGRGLGVHKALDQIGAFVGPLLVAGVVALTGALWPALLVLVVPGAGAIWVLVWLRTRSLRAGSLRAGHQPPPDAPTVAEPAERVPEPAVPEPAVPEPAVPARFPRRFWWLAASAGAATAGLVTFGIISFHLAREQVFSTTAIPLVYAVGMAAAAVAALITGWCYERVRGWVLLSLPFLVAAVPPLAFTNNRVVVILGIISWGAAVGVQDSTVKALVADLVPHGRRATAYGAFAAVQGGAALAGGAVSGVLYSRSVPALVATVAALQLVALVLLVGILRNRGVDSDTDRSVVG